MGFFKQYGEELRDLQEFLAAQGKKMNFFASYWSVKEVAAFLGLSEQTVEERGAGLRVIPCHRLGTGTRQTIRFKAGDVIAFRERIESRTKIRDSQ